MKKLLISLLVISGITCFAQDEKIFEKYLDDQGIPKMIVYKDAGIEYDKDNLDKFLRKELQLSEHDTYMCIDTFFSADKSIHYSFQ